MASFVGTLNVVSARVVEAATGRIRVDGQEIRAAKPITVAADGARVTAALRPEMLSMGEGGGSGRFRASVEDVTFLGSVVRIRVRLADSPTIISVDTFNDPNLRVPTRDDAVIVSFPPEAVLVLDAPPAETTEALIAEG